MPDIYEIKTPGGRVLHVELDNPPTEDEEAKIISEIGAQDGFIKRYTTSTSISDKGMATLVGMDDKDFSSFKKAKVGDRIKIGGRPVLKTGDELFEAENPAASRPERAAPVIGPDLGDTAFAAAVRSAAADAPGAAAAMGTFGTLAANPFIQSLPPIGRVGIPLAGGALAAVGGSFATRKAIKKNLPILAEELEQGEVEHPVASLVGANLAQAPFSKVGTGLRLLERGFGAGVGGGIQAGVEAAGGPLDIEAAKRIAIATAGGAAFTDPTKLGGRLMDIGAAAPFNRNPVTSKLGNASTKNSLVENTVASNELALEPPPPQAPFPDIQSIGEIERMAAAAPPPPAGAPAAVSGEGLGDISFPNRAIKPRLTDQPREEYVQPVEQVTTPRRKPTLEIDYGATPDLPEPDIAKQVEAQNEFNNRVQRTIENLAEEGVELDRQTAVKLARISDPNEFNAARQQLIDSVRGEAPEIPAKGPIKSLEDLPPKLGQDEVVMPEPPEETYTATVVKTKPPVEREPAVRPPEQPKATQVPKVKAEAPKAPETPTGAIETAKVKLPSGEVIITKRPDGSWYGPSGEVLSGGSKQFAIERLRHVRKLSDDIMEVVSSTENGRAKAERNVVGSGPKFNMPEGLSEGDVYVASVYAKPEIVDRLYSEIVKLNPRLANIKKPEGEYTRGGISGWKSDVIAGAASRIPVEDIRYFVQEMRGSATTGPHRLARGGSLQWVGAPEMKPKATKTGGKSIPEIAEAAELKPSRPFQMNKVSEMEQFLKNFPDDTANRAKIIEELKIRNTPESGAALAKIEAATSKIVPEKSKEEPKIQEKKEKTEAEKLADEWVKRVEAIPSRYIVRRREEAGLYYDKSSSLSETEREASALFAKKITRLGTPKLKGEAGSIINPFEGLGEPTELGRRALEAANEPLLRRMAEIETGRVEPSVFDRWIGKVATPEVTETIAFPAQGEGRSPSKESAAINNMMDDLLPTRDSITGEELPENIKENARRIFEGMTQKAANNDAPPPEPATAEALSKGPEEYVPLLTDLVGRFPKLDKPIIRPLANGISNIAKALRNKFGLVEDNIGDVYKPLKGKLYERAQYIGRLAHRLITETEKLGELARKNLTKDEFMNYDAANLSGDRDAAMAIFKGKKDEAELIAAYDRNQAAKKAARDLLIEAGRDVGLVDNYFMRILHDRDGLLRAMGRERSVYDDAVRAAETTKGRPLTDEEKTAILNSIVGGSIRQKGAPGFLKERTINTITRDLLKFYEPSDVADVRWAMAVARDVGNRKFFGKIDPDASGTFTNDSSFGRTVKDGVDSGAIRGRGLDIIKQNMNDLFVGNRLSDRAITKLANIFRKMQVFGYLADIQSAIIQFADVFSIMREYGIGATSTAYGKGRPDIKSLGILEGNLDVEEFARSSKTSRIGNVYRAAVKNLIGRADEFQKSASLKAAMTKISKEVNNPKSAFMKRIDAEYSRVFKDRWPEMRKSLQSKDFANGIFDENSSLFMFAELARLQPITPSGRAQGYHTASPFGKLVYGLRTYWIKQLGILRNQSYNVAKRGNVSGGMARALSYATMVLVGQQAFQLLKDLSLGRDIQPEEYAAGGILQILGVPRYSIYRRKQVGTGTAALETLVPGVGIVNDIGHDIFGVIPKYLGKHRQADTNLTIPSFESMLQNLETTKYIPGVGREVYSWFGKGALKQEKERERKMRGGAPRPSTIEEIINMVSPDDAQR